MSDGRVWGKKWAAMLFSLDALSMQVSGTGGRVSIAGIKNETPWAMGLDLVAGVQTVHNRTVVVCEMGEDEDSGSGKYELLSVTHR